MKKLILSIVLTITAIQLTLAEYPYLPQCVTNTSAGGVIVVIPVHTNIATGVSFVLPIGVKMFNEVTNNPLWYVSTFYFGPKVYVLPRIDIEVPPGYMYYGTPVDGHPDYVYSGMYPIFIDSTSNFSTWTNDYYFTLFGNASWVNGNGPCQISSGDDHLGLVDATLYAGSNTNGLDGWTGWTWITNSLMKRFGLGACDLVNGNPEDNKAAVSFVYFNLPPKTPSVFYWHTNIWTGEPEYVAAVCQPATNFLDRIWFMGPAYTNTYMPWCEYDTNYAAGFVFSACNSDNKQNWPNYPYPCETNPYTFRFYTLRYGGDTNCVSQSDMFFLLNKKMKIKKSTFRRHLTE